MNYPDWAMVENFSKNTDQNIGNVWRNLTKRFEKSKIASANLDARILVAHALNIDQLQLALDEQRLVAQDDLEKIEGLALRRLKNEPVARILGTKEFYGLEFLLNEATLVPRPETELLVDLGIDFLAEKTAAKILELGVGSGCVIISLLKNNKDAKAFGVDISAKALEVAISNGKAHEVDERINWVCGSWFEPLDKDKKFDLIVSNPPYIDTKTISTLALEVREYDPMDALDGGERGLVAYERIIRGAKARLMHRGVLLLEIGFDQSEEVAKLCQSAGFTDVKLHLDLAGQPRVIEARR
ncbi:Peptide chain release factor N(5)-glutamine methyltransferase [hydrothermal vent metagenome]|uniref:peptide chain release factor N(5)-glutamine methyltransferase n=1 Tax=hydrothermal vent metagenome TaxID=652676 RepID=A0A3B0TYH2_9ZZZZ